MKQDAIADFHRKLAAWYGKNGRSDLPWRLTRDPYAIYISEVMLQQTQVKTVLERYYFPFLQRFPTLQSLANAPQDDVLKCWQGLGYYNRAINLQRAAQNCNGTLPSNIDALLALPGIGKNTAHALLVFGFHQPVAVLEANVKRVIARIFALKNTTDKVLWDKATALLNHRNPFDYNQAMMDLGSLICTPKSPACSQCPAATICQGKSDPTAYPTKKLKAATPTRKRTLVALRDRDHRYFMQPRTSRFLNGLYGFIELPFNQSSLIWNAQEFELKNGQSLGAIHQTYSHFKLDGNAVLLDITTRPNASHWHEFSELEKLPMSKADEKIVKLLESKHHPNHKK